MPAIPRPTDDECYLFALMDDPSGIDLAEFAFTDDTPGRTHRRWRVWDYQWPWYLREGTFHADKCARSMGKTQGMIMRACAFPLNFPGQEMLITAPELNHLGPIVDKIEEKFKTVRFLHELLPSVKGGGIRHQPQFQASFTNGARIMGRLPGRDGKGVKGSVASGCLVLTRRGQVRVENVVVGDEVWTHNARWRPVEHVVSYFNDDVVEVAGGGHRGLVMSANHRMLARRNLNSQKQARNLAMPGFLIPAEEEGTSYYLGSPTRFEAEPVPRWFDVHGAWLAGRFVADGFTWSRPNGVVREFGIVCEGHEVAQIRDAMDACGVDSVSRVKDSGAYDVRSWACDLAGDLVQHFGKLAVGKRLPVWLLGAPQDLRAAFLDGYLTGDGSYDVKKDRWTASTASKELAVSLRLLGQSLGFVCGLSWVDPKVTQICGVALKTTPQRSYRVTFTVSGRNAVTERGTNWQKVRSVTPAPGQMVYDLHVADDHSYLADGLWSHNQHPLVLEMDEGQDYPNQGWLEIIETMKHGIPGAQWRVHGVSNGVRDFYYRVTSGESDIPFVVHEFPAMYRPTWSAEERRNKIALYGGSRDNPDYKRNIYGEHGSVSDKVFVLARLMATVRMNESTWATEYNANVYNRIKIEGESLEGRPIEAMLSFPSTHLHASYASYWAGMDLGFTNDPTELLVFGQIKQRRGQMDVDVLRLLSRIHLMRISAPDQERVIEEVFAFYGDRLRALSLDKTGVGLPIWQHMDGKPALRARIKGYGFSEKKAVTFDDRPLVGKETALDAVIEKNVIAYATEKLREYVDGGQIELPFDKEILTEWQGQTVVYSRENNGTRQTRYGGGSLHSLDAAKLMILGKELEAIEAALGHQSRPGPVLDIFAD